MEFKNFYFGAKNENLGLQKIFKKFIEKGYYRKSMHDFKTLCIKINLSFDSSFPQTFFEILLYSHTYSRGIN